MVDLLIIRKSRWIIAGLALLAWTGCSEPTETPVAQTPSEVIEPEPAPLEAETTTTEVVVEPETSTPEPAEPTPAPVPEPAETAAEPEPQPEETAVAEAEVEFTPITFDGLLKSIADNDAKYTLVDCWASWCGPCKENFPHVLEMDAKYGSKGLKVISMSFDAGTGEPEYDTKEIEAAKQFLAEQKAKITNHRLDEERDLMFEKFDISTIPAVFVYDADGKEVKRYTWDDPNNQFTYEQVEKEIAAMLAE